MHFLFRYLDLKNISIIRMKYLKRILARCGELCDVAELSLGCVGECEAFGFYAVEVRSQFGDSEVRELADDEVVFFLKCYLREVVFCKLLRHITREEDTFALNLDVERRCEVGLLHVLGLDIRKLDVLVLKCGFGSCNMHTDAVGGEVCPRAYGKPERLKSVDDRLRGQISIVIRLSEIPC